MTVHKDTVPQHVPGSRCVQVVEGEYEFEQVVQPHCEHAIGDGGRVDFGRKWIVQRQLRPEIDVEALL